MAQDNLALPVVILSLDYTLANYTKIVLGVLAIKAIKSGERSRLWREFKIDFVVLFCCLYLPLQIQYP